jgi:hypothetical protein
MNHPLTILVLAPFDGADATAVRDFLFSFNAYSAHRYRYVFDYRQLDARFDLTPFDVILLFWTVDLLAPEMSEAMRARIAGARALKVLFRQDDYRDVDATNEAIRRLDVQVMFTCVTDADHERFYPRHALPRLEACYTVLPGYVPRYLERVRVRPDASRPIDIGYRSRAMPVYLGDLGQDKRIIAERFQVLAEQHGLRSDISIREEDRLYGRRWLRFLTSCRCVLGTPSGASVVDFTGDIRRNCERHLALHPDTTYSEAKARFFADVDGRLSIDTVSPRVFEAAALRCTMVNHEGAYGGMLEPDRHYICVKRDYSNAPEVVDRIRDRAFCRRLAENAHADLIASGRFSYAALVRRVDETLARHARASSRAPGSALKFYASSYVRHGQAMLPFRDRYVIAPSPHLAFETIRRGLSWLPRSRRGPMLSRLIQNPQNFALKASTTWRIALTTPPLRSLLAAYLGARRAGARIPLFELLDDVRKLDIIRRALAGRLMTPHPFDVVARRDAGSGVVTLTSTPRTTDGVDGRRAEEADIEGPIAVLLWDHSALGHQVVYALGRRRWLTASVGPGGVHRFDAVVRLLQRRPDLVRPVLAGILGVAADARRARGESSSLKSIAT